MHNINKERKLERKILNLNEVSKKLMHMKDFKELTKQQTQQQRELFEKVYNETKHDNQQSMF
jgi:hypothetical protein